MPYSLDELKKVEGGGRRARGVKRPPAQRLTAVFKVKEPNYVPAQVELRTRIDAEMFTGSFAAAVLPELEADEQVTQLSLAEPIQALESDGVAGRSKAG